MAQKRSNGKNISGWRVLDKLTERCQRKHVLGLDPRIVVSRFGGATR